MTAPASPRRTGPPDVLSEQGRALGDPTRYAIFRYLDRARGPVGVAELTEHVGLHHNAVRQHLAKLRDAGLVVEEAGEPAGPGRPSLRYRPTPGAADRWDGTSPYEDLSAMLVELLRGGAPREVGRDAGRRLARQLGPTADGVELLEGVARRLGFEPRREERRGRTEVVLDRCPFASSAERAPELICELHHGLAEGVTEVSGGPLRVTGLVIRPPRRAGCRLQLAPLG